MTSLGIRLALVCLCLAAIPASGLSDPVAVGTDDPLPSQNIPVSGAQATPQSNNTPVGISLGPVRIVNVSMTREKITVGEQTEVLVTVANVGDEPGDITVNVTAGRIPIGQETLRVEPGEERHLRFTFRPETRGEYLILANGRSPGVLVVQPKERTTVWDHAARYTGWGAFVLGGAVLVCSGLLGAAVVLGRGVAGSREWLSVRTVKRLWIGGSSVLLLGVLAGGGLPVQGAIAGVLGLVGYGLYSLGAVIYHSGH